MCELMGLCFARPVRANFSIRPFWLRAQENADGWGLAWYPDQSAIIVKEPLGWHQSGYARFLETYPHLESRIYIAHVRRRTFGGPPSYADTHPFKREVGGREYCFAHNGTLGGALQALTVERFQPLGNTDSEHVFCHLLQSIAARWGHLDDSRSWLWLRSELSRLNAMGQLNCLLSDGRRLLAYRDDRGSKGLAWRTERCRPEPARRLEDTGIRVDLETDQANSGVIVATRPLDTLAWHDLGLGELIVVEQGRLRFSSLGDRDARQPAPGAVSLRSA